MGRNCAPKHGIHNHLGSLVSYENRRKIEEDNRIFKRYTTREKIWEELHTHKNNTQTVITPQRLWFPLKKIIYRPSNILSIIVKCQPQEYNIDKTDEELHKSKNYTKTK